MNKKKIVRILSAAAAAAFITAPIASITAHANGDANIKCEGGNACKGKSACKTANSACKGQNSCKGQGFVITTEKKCAKLGGQAKSMDMGNNGDN